MQTNPNNPYDEVFGNLSKIVEEIVRNMPEAEHARIIGYTIVTRHASGEPGITPAGRTAGTTTSRTRCRRPIPRSSSPPRSRPRQSTPPTRISRQTSSGSVLTIISPPSCSTSPSISSTARTGCTAASWTSRSGKSPTINNSQIFFLVLFSYRTCPAVGLRSRGQKKCRGPGETNLKRLHFPQPEKPVKICEVPPHQAPPGHNRAVFFCFLSLIRRGGVPSGAAALIVSW